MILNFDLKLLVVDLMSRSCMWSKRTFTTRKKAYNNIYFVDLMPYMSLYVVLIYYNDFYNSYRNNYDIYVNSNL